MRLIRIIDDSIKTELTGLIGRWVDLLRPGYERIAKTDEVSARLTLLEKEAVLVSLENLMTFPWISEAVGAGSLQLHGLWTDIATGAMEAWSPGERAFAPL